MICLPGGSAVGLESGEDGEGRIDGGVALQVVGVGRTHCTNLHALTGGAEDGAYEKGSHLK